MKGLEKGSPPVCAQPPPGEWVAAVNLAGWSPCDTLAPALVGSKGCLSPPAHWNTSMWSLDTMHSASVMPWEGKEKGLATPGIGCVFIAMASEDFF